MKQFKGVIPAPIIPYDESGRVKKETFKEFIDFLIERGIHGLFVLGTFSGGPLLSMDEFRMITDLLIEHVNGRVDVIIHVGAPSAAMAIEKAKQAEKAGADTLSSVPPYYFQHTDDAVLGYFKRLLDAVSCPLMVYNNPNQVGYGISPDLLASLADSGISGIKDSSFDLKVWVNYRNRVNTPGFQWINGTVPLFFPSLMMGAAAGVGGPANVFPELQIECYDEFQKGNYQKCVELQLRLSRLVQIQGIGGVPYTSLIDMWELRTGKEFGYPHEPLQRISKAIREQIKQALINEGLIEKK